MVTVGAVTGAPTISGFTPTAGPAATPVTLTGTNFDAGSGATRAYVNASLATISVTNSTTATLTVPANTGSGKIRVSTARGTAISSADFLIPPGGIAAADIVDVKRLVAGGSAQSLAVGAPLKHGLVLFDSTAGDLLSLQLNTLTLSGITSLTYTIYDPTNALVVSGLVSATARSIHLPPLLMSGTYSILFSPGASGTFSATMALQANQALSIDGASITASTASAGQSVRYKFFASQTQYLGLGLNGITFTPSSNSAVTVTVYSPDGQVVPSTPATPCNSTNPGAGCNLNLVGTFGVGLYTVILVPPVTSTLSATLTLSSDVTGALTPGTPFSLNLSRVGQNGRLTFSGTAGGSLGVEVAGVSTTPSGQSVTVTVLKPDTTTLSTVSAVAGTGGFLRLENLPVTGTYTVFVDPPYASTAAMQVTVAAPPLLTINGAALPVSTTAVGETVWLTFTGTAGQNLGLGVTGMTHTPLGGPTTSLVVYRPDGTSLTSNSCTPNNPGSGCSVNLTNLPLTGTYSVLLTPPANTTITGSILLSTDVTGALTPGTPLSLTLSRAGQNGRLTFSGTAGGSLGLEVAGVSTTPSGQSVTVTVLKPDGTTLAPAGFASAATGAFFNFASLPVTGTYTVFLDPPQATTAAMQVTVDAGPALTIGGSAVSFSTTVVGETVRLTFAGTAGQNLGLGVTGMTHTPLGGPNSSLVVYRPDGTSLTSTACSPNNPGSGCSVNLTNLPVTGTYSVLLTPPVNTTITGSVLLSTDVTGLLTVGTPQSLSLSRAGQNGRLTFTGTVGGSLGLEVAGVSTTPSGQSVTVTVLKPDTTTLGTGFATAANGAFLNFANLPMAGTYTVFVDPPQATTTAMQVTVDAGPALAINGAAVPVSTTLIGETVRLTFAGTAGQNLGLGVTGMTHTPLGGFNSTLTVYLPNGTSLTSAGCSPNFPGSGCSVNLTNLPVTGTYSVLLTPPANTTITGSVLLSTDVTGTLTAGTPLSLTLSRAGQNGRLTFTGNTGQSRTLTIGSLATVPTGQTVLVTVYRPDGVSYQSANMSGTGGTLNMASLPATGTYTVVIDPASAVTATMTVTVSP